MFDYPFRVPARFAPISGGSQEGSLRLDPDFRIIAVAYPMSLRSSPRHP